MNWCQPGFATRNGGDDLSELRYVRTAQCRTAPPLEVPSRLTLTLATRDFITCINACTTFRSKDSRSLWMATQKRLSPPGRARRAAIELKDRFPSIQIKIYDAAAKQ